MVTYTDTEAWLPILWIMCDTVSDNYNLRFDTDN